MAELDDEGTFELGGLLLDSAVYCVKANVEGLGSARLESEVQARQSDGQVMPRFRLADRAVTLRVGLTDPAAADIDALKVAMSPSVDRQTPKLLRWLLPNEVTKRMEVQPAPGTSLEIPGSFAYLNQNQPEAVCHLIAQDPVIYSDELFTASFTVAGGGTDTDTLTNGGTLSAVSPGSSSLGTMSWTITVAGGGCTNPFLRHDDFNGETWRVVGTFAAAAVITVGYDRITRLGSDLLSAEVRGPGTCPVPQWPVLRASDAQDFEMGCDSGGFTATLSYRSTW